MSEPHAATFERFYFELLPDDALSGSQPGMDAAPEIEVLRKTPYIAAQLEQLDPVKVRDELYDYGAWEEFELADHDANLDRVLWLACCNIREEVEP